MHWDIRHHTRISETRQKRFMGLGTLTATTTCCPTQVSLSITNPVVLTNNSYKKNVAYDLLRKLSKSIYEANPSLQDKHATITDLDIKEVVESMCRDYQNPRNLDKVSMAQMQVDKARSVMQINVEGMVKNIQDAEVTISVVKAILNFW